MIGVASTAITLALVFYTIGVFAERRSGTLTASHLIFFYLGLACDTAGTAAMSMIANAAFGAALNGAGAIGLVLYLRGDARRA